MPIVSRTYMAQVQPLARLQSSTKHKKISLYLLVCMGTYKIYFQWKSLSLCSGQIIRTFSITLIGRAVVQRAVSFGLCLLLRLSRLKNRRYKKSISIRSNRSLSTVAWEGQCIHKKQNLPKQLPFYSKIDELFEATRRARDIIGTSFVYIQTHTLYFLI